MAETEGFLCETPNHEIMMDRPALIVVAPVRNEAWVLDAFLTCASSWADRIILADQHSTDGSREIAAKYPKVFLVDNDGAEMDQAAARLLLFKEVDKIEGDKIVFALDADEFLSEGFESTEGWKRIMESQPNELFSFQWLNLYGDYNHVVPSPHYMEWACHFGPDTRIADLYRQCEDRSVHEMRVPCLSVNQVSYVEIPDIKFVHLARLNLIRQKNKEDFYQVSSVAKLKKRISAVTAFRSYHRTYAEIEELSQIIGLYSVGSVENKACLVRQKDYGQYYIDEMKAIFKRDGYDKYLKLDIWENPCLKAKGITPNVPLKYCMLHAYLRKTQPVSNRFVVKIMDKLLKYIC